MSAGARAQAAVSRADKALGPLSLALSSRKGMTRLMITTAAQELRAAADQLEQICEIERNDDG